MDKKAFSFLRKTPFYLNFIGNTLVCDYYSPKSLIEPIGWMGFTDRMFMYLAG